MTDYRRHTKDIDAEKLRVYRENRAIEAAKMHLITEETLESMGIHCHANDTIKILNSED